MSDNPTLNVGLRWEYEPGPTDPGQPAVAAARSDAADPRDAGDAAASCRRRRAADGEQGLRLHLQRRLGLRERGNPHAWHSTPWNFLPRFGANYR
jgi:hypothetical protein